MPAFKLHEALRKYTRRVEGGMDFVELKQKGEPDFRLSFLFTQVYNQKLN